MHNFKDFGIKPTVKNFDGEKIKVSRILNTKIIILDYKIDDSKIKEGTKYLTLHISRNEQNNVVFVSGVVLIQQIEQVSKNNFPFTTKIVKEKEYYEFT